MLCHIVENSAERMPHCQSRIRSVGECTHSIAQKQRCFFGSVLANQWGKHCQSFVAGYSATWIPQWKKKECHSSVKPLGMKVPREREPTLILYFTHSDFRPVNETPKKVTSVDLALGQHYLLANSNAMNLSSRKSCQSFEIRLDSFCVACVVNTCYFSES